MSLDLRKVPMTDTLKQKARDDYVLYSETPSRFIVTVSPDKQKEFENLMKDTIFAQIGTVKGKSLEIIGLDGNSLLNEPIDGLKKSWQRTLDW